jgi:hypothetical protein
MSNTILDGRLVLNDYIVQRINTYRLVLVESSIVEPGIFVNPYIRSVLIANADRPFTYNDHDYIHTNITIIFYKDTRLIDIKLRYGVRVSDFSKKTDYSTAEVSGLDRSEIFSILCYLKEPRTLLQYESTKPGDKEFFINKINKLILEYAFE